MGRRRLFFLFLVVVAAVLALGATFVYGRPDSSAAKRFARVLPYPAALVGPSTVWANEVFTQERYTVFYSQKTNQVIPEPAKIRADVLDHLIEVALVRREAIRHRVTVSKKEVDDQFESIAQQNGGREQVLTTLRELYGMDERAFRNLMVDQLYLEKFKREVLVTVNVRHILVKDHNKANELVRQAKEGADFTELARTHSEDTGSRDLGGSLGFVGRGATVKAFEEVAFTLAPGEISDPVQSQFGWHIIKVEERRGSIDQSYADWLAEAKQRTKIIKLLVR
jgi:foldase protein PrsA